MEIIFCKHCGFNHVDPLPTEEELKALYENEYYQKTKPGFLDKSVQEEHWLNAFHGTLYKKYFELLPKAKKILDVGCGVGEFMQLGHFNNWQVSGIELSPVAAQVAINKGLDVKVGNFEDHLPPRETLDVVHFGNVLEHVRHPVGMIKIAMTLLKPGGLISVIVPNDWNPLQEMLISGADFGRYWEHETHLNYFNFDTLRSVLKRCNLSVEYESSTFPMEFFLLMGHDYVKDPQLGHHCHNLRMNFERTFFATGHDWLLDRIYRALASEGIGRHCVMIARKALPSHEVAAYRDGLC